MNDNQTAITLQMYMMLPNEYLLSPSTIDDHCVVAVIIIFTLFLSGTFKTLQPNAKKQWNWTQLKEKKEENKSENNCNVQAGLFILVFFVLVWIKKLTLESPNTCADFPPSVLGGTLRWANLPLFWRSTVKIEPTRSSLPLTQESIHVARIVPKRWQYWSKLVAIYVHPGKVYRRME